MFTLFYNGHALYPHIKPTHNSPPMLWGHFLVFLAFLSLFNKLTFNRAQLMRNVVVSPRN